MSPGQSSVLFRAQADGEPTAFQPKGCPAASTPAQSLTLEVPAGGWSWSRVHQPQEGSSHSQNRTRRVKRPPSQLAAWCLTLQRATMGAFPTSLG